MRLCTNIGFFIAFNKTTWFPLDDKSLKRAKLDYFSNIKPKYMKNYKSY